MTVLFDTFSWLDVLQLAGIIITLCATIGLLSGFFDAECNLRKFNLYEGLAAAIIKGIPIGVLAACTILYVLWNIFVPEVLRPTSPQEVTYPAYQVQLAASQTLADTWCFSLADTTHCLNTASPYLSPIYPSTDATQPVTALFIDGDYYIVPSDISDTDLVTYLGTAPAPFNPECRGSHRALRHRGSRTR